MKKLAKLLTLAAMMILGMTLAGCGSSSKLNLADYLSITYSGVDGNGSAYLSFDASSMELDYAGVKDGIPTQKELEKMFELAQFEFSIFYDLDQSEGLSNGDQVTATVTYDSDLAKDAKVNIGTTEKTFTVEGLTEPISVDPFDAADFGEGKDVNIVLEGTEPFAYLTIENNADHDSPLSYVTYEVVDEQKLHNGDEVTIIASLKSNASELGYVLTEEETTITVEGLDKFASSAEDFTAEFLQTVAEDAYGECLSESFVQLYDEDENGNVLDYTTSNTRSDNYHVGENALLFVNSNPDDRDDLWFTDDYSFLLVPIYRTISTDSWYNWDTMTSEPKVWSEVFTFFKFSNVVVHADGSITYDTSYIDRHGNFVNSNVANIEYLNWFAGDYDVIEVPMP